jgi:peroxiredoxin
MKQLTLSILILLTCAFIVFGSGSKEKDQSMMMMDSSDKAEDTGAMMADDTMAETGGKVSFTDLDAARAIAAKGPAVLFFYADWCPTCQAAIKDINEHINRLDDITVVVVNYDKARNLKEKYMVTYQHTFVQIDENGEKIAVWNGGGVSDILKNTVRGGEM